MAWFGYVGVLFALCFAVKGPPEDPELSCMCGKDPDLEEEEEEEEEEGGDTNDMERPEGANPLAQKREKEMEIY